LLQQYEYMKKDNFKERYERAVISFNLLKEKEDGKLIFLSVLRLATFIGGLILIWLGFSLSIATGFLLTFLSTFLFLFLLKLYSVHSARREFLSNLAVINLNESRACNGDLSAFETGSSYIDTGHDFSNDVDLFGKNSLFQYLNRTVTGYGRDILAGWLSNPYELSRNLVIRQETIKELSLKEQWRHQFMAHGMKKTLNRSEITELLEWICEENSIKSSSPKKLLIYLLPASAVITLLLMVPGYMHYSFFVSIFLVNLLIITIGLRKTNKIHRALSQKYRYLDSLDVLLKVFENESFESEVLNEIKLNISGREVSAATSVRKLSRLIEAFDSRMNILVGFLLNGLLLWDYQCIQRLEKWKSEYKNQFPLWLEMVGQIDAYISLGNYAYNNPGFIYPVISDNNVLFSAKNIGHQLIDEEKRVCNDFALERKGIVCIISGANMAGKSTFLRTIAINYILGMSGAPVCATEMNFLPSKIFTSMRTTDSLSDNESYFYAELRRLKTLKIRNEDGEPIFFILDEILKGTNSNDKSLGSKLFLRRIVESGGSGLIATHDTSLGELETDLPGLIINKCFEIEIDGEIIKFDYKLQNGITHKMNAALLMKQMGILE